MYTDNHMSINNSSSPA